MVDGKSTKAKRRSQDGCRGKTAVNPLRSQSPKRKGDDLVLLHPLVEFRKDFVATRGNRGRQAFILAKCLYRLHKILQNGLSLLVQATQEPQTSLSITVSDIWFRSDLVFRGSVFWNQCGSFRRRSFRRPHVDPEQKMDTLLWPCSK